MSHAWLHWYYFFLIFDNYIIIIIYKFQYKKNITSRINHSKIMSFKKQKQLSQSKLMYYWFLINILGKIKFKK